jgi:hypothetical protein
LGIEAEYGYIQMGMNMMAGFNHVVLFRNPGAVLGAEKDT